MAIAIDNRSVLREDVLPKSSSLESARPKEDSDYATRKTYSFSTYSVLTWHLEPLHDLFLIFPKSKQIFRVNIHTADLERGVKDTEFQFKKKRILIINYLLEKIKDLDKWQIRILADAVLNRQDPHAVHILGLLKLAEKDRGSTSGGFFSSAVGYVKRTPPTTNIFKLATEEALWRDANNFASSVPDSLFLSGLKNTPLDGSLRDAIVKAEEIAHTYLRKLIESLVDRIGTQIFSYQTVDCDKEIQLEVTSEEDEELVIIRSKFVHQVEDLSRERFRSYVCHNLE